MITPILLNVYPNEYKGNGTIYLQLILINVLEVVIVLMI